MSESLDEGFDEGLFAQKYLISRFVTAEDSGDGSQDAYKGAVNFYNSIYRPEKIRDTIKPSEKFPNRYEVLESPLNLQNKTIPTKKEFVEKSLLALKKADYSKAVSEKNISQLEQMMQGCSLTIIWTAGDVSEQMRKIGSNKIGKLRRSVAIGEKQGVRDVLRVYAKQKKMEKIPDIINDFEERSIRTVFLIEDNLRNLLEAKRLLEEKKINVLPIYVNSSNKQEVGVITIANFSEMSELLQKYLTGGQKVAAIIDYDGVISNDELRKKEQVRALKESFKNEGWL